MGSKRVVSVHIASIEAIIDGKCHRYPEVFFDYDGKEKKFADCFFINEMGHLFVETLRIGVISTKKNWRLWQRVKAFVYSIFNPVNCGLCGNRIWGKIYRIDLAECAHVLSCRRCKCLKK